MQSGVWRRVATGRDKAYVLLLLVLLALASAGGYWFLGRKIEAGEKQIAAGQENLVVGMISLEKGRAELENGQQRLSKGNEKYREAKQNLLLVWTDKLLKSGGGFKEARKRIVEGERKIADGEERISVGERRMDAGKQELRLGAGRLRLARIARVACAAGAFLFSSFAFALKIIIEQGQPYPATPPRKLAHPANAWGESSRVEHPKPDESLSSTGK